MAEMESIMTNTYQSLVNVDDTKTLDIVFWLVEERGLSLRLLDAELDLEEAQAFVDGRLAELEKKGLKAKEAVWRRYELEKRAESWKSLPDWYSDQWFEDNAEVCMSDYHYIKQQYKQTRKVLNEIISRRAEKLVEIEKQEFDHEYISAIDEKKPDVFNSIHWEGARKAGKERLARIKYLKAIGHLSDDLMAIMLRATEEKKARKEICNKEYLQISILLNRWMGRIRHSKNLEAKLEVAETNSNKSEFKSMPYEPSVYSMDMESAIDLKRNAEAISIGHNINFEEACCMLMDGAEY